MLLAEKLLEIDILEGCKATKGLACRLLKSCYSEATICWITDDCCCIVSFSVQLWASFVEGFRASPTSPPLHLAKAQALWMLPFSVLELVRRKSWRPIIIIITTPSAQLRSYFGSGGGTGITPASPCF